jgi:hypothetical protein
VLKPQHFLSEAYLAAAAAGVLRRYFAGAPRTLPVNVELLAEHLFDLMISWEPLADEEGGLTLGGVRPRTRQLVLNDLARAYFEEHPGSENFTKAHEVAHIVLHVAEEPGIAPLFPDVVGPPPIVCTSAVKRPPRELQADKCAAFLLMPEDLMRAECTTRQLIAWPPLYDLAAFLGVSISALCIRLQELRLVRIEGRAITSLQTFR